MLVADEDIDPELPGRVRGQGQEAGFGGESEHPRRAVAQAEGIVVVFAVFSLGLVEPEPAHGGDCEGIIRVSINGACWSYIRLL